MTRRQGGSVPRRVHEYYVYMMTNRSHTTLYTGMTNDLVRRVHEHKHRSVSGFTSRYNIDRLLHFESYRYVDQAIAREKEIKGWRREKKVALIREHNPDWRDLTGLVLEEEGGDEEDPQRRQARGEGEPPSPDVSDLWVALEPHVSRIGTARPRSVRLRGVVIRRREPRTREAGIVRRVDRSPHSTTVPTEGRRLRSDRHDTPY
jgi:putative endonuclease